jgi:hypothetical protein
MLQLLLDTLLGCSHQHTTFPLTPARKITGNPPSNAVRNGTYVTCLDCGKEFAYDWQAMRVGQPVASQVAATTTAQPSFR